MKQIAHIFLIVLGLGTGFLRWVDLVNFVDYETGFVLAGSVWLRYALVAVLILLAVGASFMASARPHKLEKGSWGLSAMGFVVGALFAAQSAVQMYVGITIQPFGAKQISLGVLGFVTAAWLLLIAFALGKKEYSLPAGGVIIGIVGTLWFYLLVILCFAENHSSFYRAAPTIRVFAAAAMLWFSASLLRALYYPETMVGRKLYASGMASYYMAVSFVFPQALCDWLTGNATTGALAETVLLVGMGVFGALFAARALSEELI